jgi:hypothetical protein
MTQTTTQLLAIPATGLEHHNGDVVLTVHPHPQAGFLIRGRRNGAHAPELCSRHDFEYDAIRAWKRLVAEHTPAQAETPAVRLAPVAKGTTTKVTDPQHTALVVAEMTGRVERGGKTGQVSVRVLTALAKRGYLELVYQVRTDARKVPIAGRITGPGRIRLAELTAADRETAEYAARLAANLTFDQPATSPTTVAA